MEGIFQLPSSTKTESIVITGIVQIDEVTVTVDDGRKEYALSKKDIEKGLRVQAAEDTLPCCYQLQQD